MKKCFSVGWVFGLMLFFMCQPHVQAQEKACIDVLKDHLIEKFDFEDEQELLDSMAVMLKLVYKNFYGRTEKVSMRFKKQVHQGLLERYEEIRKSRKIHPTVAREITKVHLKDEGPYDLYYSNLLYLYYLFADEATVNRWQACENEKGNLTGSQLKFEKIDEFSFKAHLDLRSAQTNRPLFITKAEVFPDYVARVGPDIQKTEGELINFIGLSQVYRRSSTEPVHFRFELNTGEVVSGTYEGDPNREFDPALDLWGNWQVVSAIHGVAANDILHEIFWEVDFKEEYFLDQIWTFQAHHKGYYQNKLKYQQIRRYKSPNVNKKTGKRYIFSSKDDIELRPPAYILNEKVIEKISYQNGTLIIKGNKNAYEYRLVRAN